MKKVRWVSILLLMAVLILMLCLVSLTGCVSKSEYEALQAEHTVLIEENTSLKAELAQIKSVYPPRDFNSTSELRDWLRDNDVSEHPHTAGVHAWYLNALEIQEDATRDGYVVSACISPFVQDGYIVEGQFVVFNSAIAGGSLWWWDPDEDSINQIPGFVQVK